MSVLEGKTWCEWCQDYTLHTGDDDDCVPCDERIAAGEAARAQASELSRLRTALRLAADEPNIDKARAIADAALRGEP